MQSRTFGWIQNPGKFENLQLAVQALDAKSPTYDSLKNSWIQRYIAFPAQKNTLQRKLDSSESTFTYKELVGTNRDKTGASAKTRQESVADGLLRVAITPQRYQVNHKHWIDTWSADGFLRWAVSLGFFKYNREHDSFTITSFGRQFSRAEQNSQKYIDILTAAMMSYAPATRILALLSDGNEHTKFDLGSHLGFIGEAGFTSYDENLMLEWYQQASDSEKKDIRANTEGTSDKYARGIVNWLIGLRLAKRIDNDSDTVFPHYQITAKGISSLTSSTGHGGHPRQAKRVLWESLGTAIPNKDYIRTRRARILVLLGNSHSLRSIMDELNSQGFNDGAEIIKSDVRGLINCGIRIEHSDDYSRLVLKDLLEPMDIPAINVTEKIKAQAFSDEKNTILERTSLDEKYYALLDYTQDGVHKSRDLEELTAEFFKNVYGLKAFHLGGGRRPDVIAYNHNFGLIIDTKAYINGYGKNIKQADEMLRYVQDNQRRSTQRNHTAWWDKFEYDDIAKDQYYFVWISGTFTANFAEQIGYVARESGSTGGALTVKEMLIGGDLIQKGELSVDELPSRINNQEIILSQRQ
ncbi:restriction endonuclease FokI C-terminal domain-containing protein [Bifidobacterium sp. ESL0745]|uniref:restriction endonuclease FokI C-terminal domain-containing protein n=1 Tax=Bifidobacterium sp. ESL0745 TaxID=2983226 RepID=UPI0023F764E3|nr:restriction endonuclease FokI C-terminal domain-containing protein [Bifidobacterium sp. ESL0745]MDF7665928.1 restriction endonuclease FokI C-terminal domain-containing protein [Bifidobacterium sp. ESL0745]